MEIKSNFLVRKFVEIYVSSEKLVDNFILCQLFSFDRHILRQIWQIECRSLKWMKLLLLSSKGSKPYERISMKVLTAIGDRVKLFKLNLLNLGRGVGKQT